MIITGTGSLPASLPVKWATSGPGLPDGAAPSTSAATSSRVPIWPRTAATGSPCRTMISGVIPAALMISPTEAATIAFDPQALLFLDRRLDATPLDEVLRLDHREDIDLAAGLGGPARGEAQRDARLRDCRRSRPDRFAPSLFSPARKAAATLAAGKLFRLDLDPPAALAFVPGDSVPARESPCRSN